MTVGGLIEVLQGMPKDKIVILTDSDKDIWDNVGRVYEDGSTIKITMDDYNPHED